MKIRIVKKNPDEAPQVMEIEDTLEAMQAIVDGSLELVRFHGLDLYCNEEGKLLEDLEANLELGYDQIVGTVFVSAADDEGNPRSLTDQEVKDAIAALNAAEYPRG